MEIECEKCGNICCVEEAKPGAMYAWCDECEDYASERDFYGELLAAKADQLKDERKYGGA